jgi:type II secretory pathway component PulJ
MRKRLDQMRKSDEQALVYAESLPRIERRMREVAQATALLPELLHAVERMTKSIDRLADRMPAEPGKKKNP